MNNSAATPRTAATGHITYLDGWRGLAIALVLQEHFFYSAAIKSGALGVDIFFVLSGFLMSRILFVKRVPLTIFYKRRISRILPVFLLFVIVVYGATYVLNRSAEWGNFFYTASFLRTYVPAFPGIWETGIPVGHLWSLNIEEHCYIFLSIITLIALLRGREGLALIAVGTLSVAIHLAYVEFPSITPASYDLRTESMANFLLISAGYYLVREKIAPYVKPWMPIVAFVLAVFCYLEGVPWWLQVIFPPYLLAFTVNHLSETPEALRRALSTTSLRMLGLWSYSIYLWQQPFYEHKDQFAVAGISLALLGAMAVALCSFYLFENPVRKWLNKNW